LLVGPPGTGKTLLAKAVAGEAKVPFFSLSGSDFVEMFVGVGASRVRDLFRQAKEKAPCIIFIDEIDAIGRARGRSISQGSNDERENTLNQLLTEMDGFGTNSGVIILAATNRADILDRALLRAGRFDRQIYVDLPDLNERKDIFKVHLRPLKLDITVDIDFLAKQTPGFSGADIANICNEAALIAARKENKVVGRQDFLDAVDRIIGGLEKKNKIVSTAEKRVIAFHEAGHATVSWLLEHASPLVKVTIVPRGRSLGAAWYLPEERQITTTDQLMDEICASLGGRAAEEIVFGKISTGALSDLEKITKQAYAMIVYYGLNDKIGNVSFYDSSGQNEYAFNRPYSEKTAELIDNEVKKLIQDAYIKTKELLMMNRDKLNKLAEKLLEKEVIFKEDLLDIFGKRPFDGEDKLVTPSNGSTLQKDGEPVIPVLPVIEKKEESSEASHPAQEKKESDSLTEKAKDDNELKLF
jgi:ATP-dependent metalloprotease FtsH